MRSFTIQIAEFFGTDVTGVDSRGKLDFIRSIGADHVVDYMQEDFTRSGPVYDLILDVAASRSLFDYKRALKPAGIFVMIGCSTLLLFQMLCIAPWLKSSSPYNRENKR